MGLRRGMTVLAALVALATPALCADEAVLRRGIYAGLTTLDPHKVYDIAEIHLGYEINEGLLAPDAQCRPVPGVAESWTLSPDGRTYRFTLRPDARWSDGRPVVAGDFVAAWRRLLRPETAAPYAHYLWPVRNAKALHQGTLTDPAALGVSAPDPRTLVVELERPAGQFLATLMVPALAPLPGGEPAAGRPAAELVVNGPYRPVAFMPGMSAKLVRNPYFHAAAQVAVPVVAYTVLEKEEAELSLFRSGELDVTWSVPQARIDWVRAHFPAAFRPAPALGTDFLAFNLAHEPWRSQPALRRALALAIDRGELSAKVLGGIEAPAVTFVPPYLPGYPAPLPAWAGWPRERREAEARRLLAEAGYGPGRPPPKVQLLYATGDNRRRAAVAVAAMWRQVLGVETDLVNVEQRILSAHLSGRSYKDVLFGRWLVDNPDPDAFLEALRADAPGFNFTGYADPAFDRALDRANSASDPEERMRLLAAAEAVILDAQPLIPLHHRARLPLVAPRVAGWQSNPLGCNPSRFLSLSPGPASPPAGR